MTADRTSLRVHPSLAIALALGHAAAGTAAVITLDPLASLVVCLGLALSLHAQLRRLAMQRAELALVSPHGELGFVSGDGTTRLDGQVLMPEMLVVTPGNRDARLVVAPSGRLRRLRVALRWGRRTESAAK